MQLLLELAGHDIGLSQLKLVSLALYALLSDFTCKIIWHDMTANLLLCNESMCVVNVFTTLIIHIFLPAQIYVACHTPYNTIQMNLTGKRPQVLYGQCLLEYLLILMWITIKLSYLNFTQLYAKRLM